MDYADKLTPKPVVHFYAAAPVHNPAAVDTELEAIIVDAPLEPMPDQGGGHGVEDLAQDEATR